MTSDAQRLADQVRRSGYAMMPGLYSPETLAFFRDTLDALRVRFGSPELTAVDPIWLADGVEVAGPGLAFYSLLSLAPELAPSLFTPSVVAVLRALLGPSMFLELVGAVMSDESRPFTEWETHLGGIDDERWRREGHRPRHREVLRVVHFLFLEDLDEATGPWRVLPREVGDPVDPPASTRELEWSEVQTLHAEAGTVLLLDESVWHAVVPRSRPGIRRFIGAYFVSPEAPASVGRDASLDALRAPGAQTGELFESLLAHRPRRP